jgi:protein O-mannosyl-transferase
VVNLLLHAAASALVYLLAARWLPGTGAFAAGLLFAVHPVQVEAVANSVGRAELLATTFTLVAATHPPSGPHPSAPLRANPMS